MDHRIITIFRESILLERNVADLYRLFSDLFPEDADFWADLVIEEENHAALIHAGVDYFVEDGLFPIEALDPDLANLQRVNGEIRATIDQFKKAAPSRKEAFELAMRLESSSGEYYFQFAADLPGATPALQLFRDLTEENKNHLERIAARFKEI